MPKIISVAARNKSHLQTAYQSFVKGVAFGAGAILPAAAYSQIKKYLDDNNVQYEEHDSTATVSNDHVHH